MNSSRHRTALMVFGMVFAVLLVNALISYLNIRRLRETDGSVRHTYDVISALGEVLATVLDAETGQRGFLITGETSFLEPYKAANARVGLRLEDLEGLVSDNDEQLANLAELKTLVHERLKMLDDVLDLQRSQGSATARSHLTSGRGKVAMERLRAKINEMEQIERKLLAERNGESETAYWTAVIAGAIASLLGLLLAVTGYILLRRDIHLRNISAANLQAANDRLEERVHERTATINNMISALRDEIQVRSEAEESAKQSAEELKRSNRELEQFAAVASHDLQEPLRKIQAFADRLETDSRAQLGEKGRDYLDRILNSASRMRRLIDDLLTYSRVTTKGLSFSPVNLHQVVEEVVGDLEGRLHQTGGTISFDELPSVAADPLQMRQLFQNLLANALKFHRPQVAPEVTVASAVIFPAADSDHGTEQGMQLQVKIRDNGIGFEPEYKERIFDLFQRLHGRDDYEGTGIGLAICKKIVERHGGTISADSIPHSGAVFTITLPLPHAEKKDSS
jgi:signal transduction histidine kinase